jgi:hypothetical protein
MEFGSRKSLVYMAFSSGVFVASVYFVRGYAAVASPEIAIAGVPVMAYLLSRFTGGGDGEVVLRGNKFADREIMIFVGLLPLSSALTLLPLAYIGLFEEPTSVVDQFTTFVSGIVAAAVILLLARPYGIKIENVAQRLVSSIRS